MTRARQDHFRAGVSDVGRATVVRVVVRIVVKIPGPLIDLGAASPAMTADQITRTENHLRATTRDTASHYAIQRLCPSRRFPERNR
jgi:hypothetical protein